MGYSVTVFFYLTIGIGVAVALWVRDTSTIATQKMFQIVTAPFFWPIYLPALLTPQHEADGLTATVPSSPDSDSMGRYISQVESELAAALHTLGDWAEATLAGERERIAELRLAWRQQANRIRELDQLLKIASSEESGNPSDADSPHDDVSAERSSPSEMTGIVVEDRSNPATESEFEGSSRYASRERARKENLQKLKSVRAQLYDDLVSTLAWVRELVTMIHLAKFTGAPASRAEELVRQIAATVKDLSDHNPG